MERDRSADVSTRRGFLAAGAGLFVFVSAPLEAQQEPAQVRVQAPQQQARAQRQQQAVARQELAWEPLVRQQPVE